MSCGGCSLLLLSPDNTPFPSQYLESVRPLLVSGEYNQMVALANEFKDSEAAQLQRYLILKSWWATNYVSRAQNLIFFFYFYVTKSDGIICFNCSASGK